MIRTIEGVNVTDIEEAEAKYAIACEMMRAGFGQCLWTSMRMTYRAAAESLEDLIHMMDPDNGSAIIAEIRNYDY